jgi:hypothetical protein
MFLSTLPVTLERLLFIEVTQIFYALQCIICGIRQLIYKSLDSSGPPLVRQNAGLLSTTSPPRWRRVDGSLLSFPAFCGRLFCFFLN